MSTADFPSPRFTGIFIPVEILELDLSFLEIILLSWIDALFCKDRGGCFASNEYLAIKLKVKENTIVKALTNLRTLNLIEDVSFDGRRRVIKTAIGKKMYESQSYAGCDLNPMQTRIEITPRVGEKSHPEYDKNPSPHIYSKEESKEYILSSDAEECSNFFFLSILKIKADFKKPNLKEWTKDFDKMLRLDNRSLIKVKLVIVWSHANDFWKSKVLSPSKLRKNFDQLELASQEPSKTSFARPPIDRRTLDIATGRPVEKPEYEGLF